MSRRKQSNPKPLKRRSEDELEELSRSHHLPSDILQVREVEPEENGSTGDIGVFTPYPLAKGSCIFGPFKVTEVNSKEEELRDDHENDKEQQRQGLLQFSWEDDEKVTVNIQNEGRWLKLIRAGKLEENVTICLQGKSLVWCEISQDIKEDTELLACYKREPEAPGPSSSDPQEEGRRRSVSPPQSSTPLLAPSPALSATTDDSLSSPASMVVKSMLRPGTPGLGRPEGERSPSLVERKSSPEQVASPQPARFPLIYGCVHCGVKFSNPRTLAAHVEFYCSKKPLPTDPAVPSIEAATVEHMELDKLSQKSDEHMYKSRSAVEAQLMAQSKHEQLSPSSRRRSDSDRSATSTPKDKPARRISSDDSPDAPASKAPKTGHTFQCPFCSYASDKKISLNRHLRMHNGADDSSRSQPTTPEIDEVSMSQENFCKECNIQFSSRKTFMGHKEYYCATRRKRHLSTGTIEDATPPPAVVAPADIDLHQQLPFLPSQAAAFAVQSFLRSPAASQAVTNMLGQQPSIVVAAPMVTPSTLSSINTPTVILQPVIALPSNMSPGRHNPMLPHSIPSGASTPTPISPSGAVTAPPTHHSSTPTHSRQQMKADLPLDLSCKKESPRAKALVAEPEKARSPPAFEQRNQKDTSGEPQDLSVKRESRTPSVERSPQPASPAGREPSLGSRTPDRPPDGVTGIPPQTAELFAAQAQMFNMMNQQAAAAAAMMYAPPNISKCLECNIVFYKHENYLIHKEHYCAGRRISKRERLLAKELSPNGPTHLSHMEQPIQNGSVTAASDSQSPGRSQSVSPKQASPPSLSQSSHSGPSKTDVPMDQSYLQVYCIPCKIKFSSNDTLNAHQQFYCPFNKENHLDNSRSLQASPITAPETDSAAGSRPDSGSGSETMDSEGGVHTCPNCGHNFPSYRLLKLHFCKASSVHIPLLRCPYCDFITQSDNRLVEHIKGHAPTKAYRCTICGYRGNTVRGMRMHGKTHVDEGQTFTDENMVEYEEPPLIPKRNHSKVVESNPVDMEAELIRLKNEPYKRRRSRKGYEKAENISPLRRQPPHICMTCNEIFSDTAKLRQHMRVHMQETTYTCRSCDLVTNDKASLVRHVKRVHESHSRSSLDSSTDGNGEIGDSASRNSDSVGSDMSVKHEPMDDSSEGKQLLKTDRSDAHPPLDDVNYAEPPSQKSGVKSEGGNDSESKTESINVKKEMSDSDVNQNRCPSNKSSDRSFTTPSPAHGASVAETVKSKSPPISAASAPSSSSATSAPVSPRPATPVTPVNGKPELTPTEILLQKKEEKSGTTYCHQCDIPFVFMSSFMAHKKYYCNSHAGERENNRAEVS